MLFLTIAPIKAQVFAATPAIAAASEQNKASKEAGAPALWRLSKGDTVIYIFGSVAMLCPNETWFSGQIKDAFDASGELVVETNVGAGSEAVARRGLYHDGQRLSTVIGPELRSQFIAAMGLPGYDMLVYDSFRPWLAALTVQSDIFQKSCYSRRNGVESILVAPEMLGNRALSYLDSVDQQIGIFADLDEARQVAYLRYMTGDIPSVITDLDTMVVSWRSGKSDAIIFHFDRMFDDMPWLKERLLINPNKKWAAWIDERSRRPGIVFVTMTAGHLSGEGSVIELLRSSGHDIERVQ